MLVAGAWAILARAAELLGSQGLRPIVYRAVQLPGAEAEFLAKKARYEKTRIGVEPIDDEPVMPPQFPGPTTGSN
jgi:hypothetical protein